MRAPRCFRLGRKLGSPRFNRRLVAALVLVAGTPAAAQNPEISAVRHAASFAVGAVAPEMIVSIFGLELANQTVIADTDPLPTTLGGSTFTVTDSGGVERDMSLFFVSTTQVNGLIPTGTALGAATLTAKTGQGSAATAALRVGSSDQGPRQTGDLPLEVAVLAPGLFAANATGQGVAAALALRVKADDSRSTEFLFEENLQPVPLNLGDTDQIFLLLFGTGIRGFSSEVRVTVGGEDVAVLGAVPQGEFVGLDQVNVGPLPCTLAGRGEVPIELTVDGLPANTVTVRFGTRFTYSANLTGNQSVPPVTTAASGFCQAELNAERTELTIRCTHTVAQPTAAHIHVSPPGNNGPVVCRLGDATSPIRSTCSGLVQALEQGNLYVNVHSAAFPGGEIRGQLQ